MSDNQTETGSVEQAVHVHQDSDGKNSKFIKCKHCTSLILKPGAASYGVHPEKTLPKVDGHEPELITKFWSVEDIFTFENMSFSKTVENMKYLSCCDCDIGPIGFQDLDDKICYVAYERVTYTDK